MKKLLLILLCAISLTSCSNNNEDPDTIVGTWYLFSINNIEVSDCEKMSTVTFNANLTATGTTYMMSNNICSIIDANSTATWAHDGNMVYTITPSNGSVEQWNIVFSDNNNTLDITNEGIVYKRQ